ELSPGGAAIIRAMCPSLCSVAVARLGCFLIRISPIRLDLGIAPQLEVSATVGVLSVGLSSALASDRRPPQHGHLRFGSLSAASLRLARSSVSTSQAKAVGVWLWKSRLRLFIYESCNIRSYMTAMTLLQQEN